MALVRLASSVPPDVAESRQVAQSCLGSTSAQAPGDESRLHGEHVHQPCADGTVQGGQIMRAAWGRLEEGLHMGPGCTLNLVSNVFIRDRKGESQIYRDDGVKTGPGL